MPGGGWRGQVSATDLPQQLGYDLDLLATTEQVAEGHASDPRHLYGIHQHHEPLQQPQWQVGILQAVHSQAAAGLVVPILGMGTDGVRDQGLGVGGGSSQGPPSLPHRLEEGPVPTFLMFLLQDDLDSCAACSLGSEVARDEAQRGAEASGGWGARASLSPSITGTWVLRMSLQMAGRMKVTD